MTTKIHAVVDALGNPLRLLLTGGHRNDVTQAEELLKGWKTTRVLADKGYDSNAVLANVAALKAEAVIPPKANRLIQRVYDKEFYKERHLVECFFNKLKQFAAGVLEVRPAGEELLVVRAVRFDDDLVTLNINTA